MNYYEDILDITGKNLFNWRHPIKSFRAIRDSKKWKRQRTKNGFCDYDLYDMDIWLTNLIHQSLEKYKEVAQDDILCKGIEFQKKFQRILDCLEELKTSEVDLPEYVEFDKVMDLRRADAVRTIFKNGSVKVAYPDPTPMQQDIIDRYFAAVKNLGLRKDETRKEAFTLLGEILPYLWY